MTRKIMSKANVVYEYTYEFLESKLILGKKDCSVDILAIIDNPARRIISLVCSDPLLPDCPEGQEPQSFYMEFVKGS